MAPKVEAACDFVEAIAGRAGLDALATLEGRAGTIINGAARGNLSEAWLSDSAQGVVRCGKVCWAASRTWRRPDMPARAHEARGRHRSAEFNRFRGRACRLEAFVLELGAGDLSPAEPLRGRRTSM